MCFTFTIRGSICVSNDLDEAFEKAEDRMAALNFILTDPCAGELKTGDPAGIYGYGVYYNKTNYEITYRIYDKDGELAVVLMAGTREDFYEELKR